MAEPTQHLETLAVHAGREVDADTGAITLPIHPSTTFERAADGSFPHGHIYSRYANPTRSHLELCLAALEGGAEAAAFASGTAAAMTVFQALGPEAHVVASADAYHGILRLLREIMAPWRLAVSLVDTSDLDAVRAAVRPETRLLWAETPSNPLLKISDLDALATIARETGAVSVCDNTFATPVLQRPLDHGFDLAMQSTTKYIGGHSDVLGGALVARQADEFWERLRFLQGAGGAVPSPFDCWLILRGAATLPLRVRAQTDNAGRLAEHLDAHPAVERVYYPGRPSHPGHALAARQMNGFGGVLSFTVTGGEAAAIETAARVRLIKRATSLGGVESLIEHRASIEGPETRAPRNLLRLSVGVEHVDDLIDDLDQALPMNPAAGLSAKD
ncbi:MAG TPA: aminotransferase class I/II-fold pyridoxal phosphate-dependent enzyme [Gammaproteobacteria bacterium]|nr:aminotransferase class I/II-fold pyridoxal phosphate-dependent enzyme [Gammaproteobacteria bacterium]